MLSRQEAAQRADRIMIGLELQQHRRIRLELLTGRVIVGEVELVAFTTDDGMPQAVKLKVQPTKGVWRDDPDNPDRMVKRWVEAGDPYLLKVLWHAIATWRDAP